jgi:cardiolipin synthase A/B
MAYLTIIGGAFLAWLILVLLFTPHIPYHIETQVDGTSDHFIHVLESTCHTTLEQKNRIEIFTNGNQFYPAMLAAIAGATETINFECYIFKKGRMGQRFIDAFCERARAGVRVTIVMDAIGSFGAFHQSARPLREAGCRVEPYQRMRWYSLARLNNRTHRELLVVDGGIAFVGGAGVADWWAGPRDGKPMWRDMMARIEGPLVSDIQGVVAENWLECCGEILTGPETYKPHRAADGSAAFAIKSSPADRATASRVLFQTLIETSTRRVLISTPYFLPDKAFRQAIRRTASRGIEIVVVVPGARTDQRWVRLASRRMYGRLLESGVRIFEYEPGMTHVKALVVDDLWAVIGTTNVDNRSFEHNDEVNVAIRDPRIAARLTTDFIHDREHSVEITLAAWQRRPVWEKLIGSVAWILERQQ